MAIIFTCKCGKRLRAKDESAGRRARFPDCGEIVAVPSKQSAASTGFERDPQLKSKVSAKDASSSKRAEVEHTAGRIPTRIWRNMPALSPVSNRPRPFTLNGERWALAR